MIITSSKNEKIKILKKQKENRFLLFLDNPKTIREGIKFGLKLNEILVSEKKQDLITEFSKLNNFCLVSEEVIKSLTSAKTPQGVIAVFNNPKRELKEPKSNFLVLDNVQDAGNVGTLLRSAQGAGFDDVFLIDSAKISNEKTIRSSMGAIFKLNIFETSKTDFLEFASKLKSKLICADMNGENIFDYNPTSSIGIVLGNEGNGISSEIKGLCKKTVKIPMENDLESLNVAVAGSIIMFEINKRK